MRTLWWYLALEALAALFIQQLIGLSTTHTVLTFLVAAALTLLLAALPTIQVPRWHSEPTTRTDGARDRISALAWAFMTRDEQVSARGVDAVRHAATVRLALLGIDLTDPDHAPAAIDLLGEPAYTLLSDGAPTPTMAQLGRCIDRLDALEPDATHPTLAPDSPAHPPSPRTLR